MNMIYKLLVSKLFLTESTDYHQCDRVNSHWCPTFFSWKKHTRAVAAASLMPSLCPSDESGQASVLPTQFLQSPLLVHAASV